MPEALSRISMRSQDVLTLQEVQRPAGAAEFLAARDRARLGRKSVHDQASFAELGRRVGLVVQVRAVQAAIDLRQLVVHVGDLEVAPLAVVVTLA